MLLISILLAGSAAVLSICGRRHMKASSDTPISLALPVATLLVLPVCTALFQCYRTDVLHLWSAVQDTGMATLNAALLILPLHLFLGSLLFILPKKHRDSLHVAWFLASCATMLFLLAETLHSGKTFDAIFTAVLSLGILLASIAKKRTRWFAPGFGTLLLITLRMTFACRESIHFLGGVLCIPPFTSFPLLPPVDNPTKIIYNRNRTMKRSTAMPEHLDLYDIHRNRTGRTIVRGTPRAQEDYVLVVHLLLFDTRGRFLTQRRTDDRTSWPGMWDISLGGHAQAGDSSAGAAAREAREELGLTLDFSGTAPVFSCRTGNVHDDYWMAQVDADAVTLRPQPEEVAELRWVSRAEWAALLAAHEVIPYTFSPMLFDLFEQHFPGFRLFPRGNPTRIRGVVFDMDGLLLDTERVVNEAWDEAARRTGFADVEHAKRACLGLNEQSTRAFFLRTYGADFDYDTFRTLTRRLAHEVLDVEVPVKEGAAALLAGLHECGIPLAVASSTREVTVRDQLSRAGLLPYFSAVITGDMVRCGKPHPEIFRKACEALGLPPEECLAFEDSINGIRSAFRAGMYPVHVPDQVPGNPETAALSWKRFSSLTEAAAFLLPMLRQAQS